MIKPSRIILIELSQPLETLTGLEDFGHVRGLVMLQGEPLGWIDVAVSHGECKAEALAAAIVAEHSSGLVQSLLAQGLRAGLDLADVSLEQLLTCVQAAGATAPAASAQGSRPKISVLLCQPIHDAVMDAAADSATAPAAAPLWIKTLASLAQQHLEPDDSLEVLVVGAPVGNLETAVLKTAAPETATALAEYRYLPSAETDPNALRNLAIAQAQGDIIAFLSPDTAVSPAWLSVLGQVFIDDPSIAAVSGPLIPWETLQESLQVQEWYQLWSQSFERQWCRATDAPQAQQSQILFADRLNPENFALRRSALQPDETFPSLSGSNAALAFALMGQGKTLLHEPRLWAYDHRSQTLEAQQAQLQAQTQARASYFAQGWLQRGAAPKQYGWTFFKESLGGLRWSVRCWLLNPSQVRPFHRAEVAGTVAGMGQILSRGLKLWKRDNDVLPPAETTHAASVDLALKLAEQSAQLQEEAFGRDETAVLAGSRTAVRTLDLEQPLTLLETLGEYDQVRLFIQKQGTLLGCLELDNRHGPLSPERLSYAIVSQFGDRLLSPLDGSLSPENRPGAEPNSSSQDCSSPTSSPLQQLEQAVADWLNPPPPEAEVKTVTLRELDDAVKVSVIITTCDRPADLRNCLRHLVVQETSRDVEIIVADNRPGSGITPPVVSEFPGVRLVSEARVGGSYGRNAAFCASTGEIVVTVDDDVTVPSNWLEKLLAPMARPEVMCVAGNVLPRELETEAQRMYEDLYNGLSQGFEPFEVDGQWLNSFNYSPPVWDLGVSANSAFRASVFHHPEIGMMPEALGPGTPVGGGEENYLIYRILKAGYTVVYEPSAYAWHRHRRTVPQLRYQIYRQMMGGTAYHLMLWLVDKDSRGIQQLTRSLPRYFTQRLLEKLQGKHNVPWSFLAVEIAGAINGVPGYWKSLKAVERQGRCDPYVPVVERSVKAGETVAVALESQTVS